MANNMKVYANVDRFQFITDYRSEHGFNKMSINEDILKNIH